MVGNGPRQPVEYDGPPPSIWEKIGGVILAIVLLAGFGFWILTQIGLL